jgi:hypothetical protein
MMGWRDKFTKDGHRKEEARQLLLKLNFGKYNYHDVAVAFQAHAFPDTTQFWGTSLIPSRRSAPEVLEALNRFVRQEMSDDELSQFVLDRPNFVTVVEEVLEKSRTPRGAASQAVLERLRAHQCSKPWKERLLTGVPHKFVMECLTDASTRVASHSDLGHWSYQPNKYPLIYSEAAKYGFLAIANIFDCENSTFGWKESLGTADWLAGVSLITRPTIMNPLDAFSNEHRSEIKRLVEPLAVRLDDIYGEPKVVAMTSRKRPGYRQTLWHSAEAGAMLAAIGIDPSACRFYR